MILYLQMVSANAKLLSNVSIVRVNGDFVMSFVDENIYQRRGIKTVLANHTFTTKKYTESNCSNLLNYIRR